MLRYLIVAVASSILLGCATQFTDANVDTLRIGMPATDIKEMFGTPDRVKSSVCGTSTPSGAWVCETWTYEGMRGKNSFTFSVKSDGKYLNDWTVNK